MATPLIPPLTRALRQELFEVWCDCGPEVGSFPAYLRSLGFDEPDLVTGGAGAPGAIVKGDGATKYKGLPISRSLPRRDPGTGRVGNRHGHQVIEYGDGGATNLQGQPIIDGHRAADREMQKHGYDRDDAPPTAPDNGPATAKD